MISVDEFIHNYNDNPSFIMQHIQIFSRHCIKFAEYFLHHGYDLNCIYSEGNRNLLEEYLIGNYFNLCIEDVQFLIQYIKPNIREYNSHEIYCDLFLYTELVNDGNKFDMNIAKLLASRYPLITAKTILKNVDEHKLELRILWDELKRDKNDLFSDGIIRYIRAPNRYLSRQLFSVKKMKKRDHLITSIKTIMQMKPIILKAYLCDIGDFQAEGEVFDLCDSNKLLHIKLIRSSVDELYHDMNTLISDTYQPMDRSIRKPLISL